MGRRVVLLVLAATVFFVTSGCDRFLERGSNHSDDQATFSARLSFSSATWMDMTFDSLVAEYPFAGNPERYVVMDINPAEGPVPIKIVGLPGEKVTLAIQFYVGEVVAAETSFELTLGGSTAAPAKVKRTEEGLRLFQPKGRLQIDLKPLDFGDTAVEQSVFMTNLSDSVIGWTAAGLAAWVSISPPSGEADAKTGLVKLKVKVERDVLSIGRHEANLVVSSGPAEDRQKVAWVNDTLKVRLEQKERPAAHRVLQGVVRERGSGKVLSGIDVSLKGQSQAAITDSDGVYRLIDPGAGHTLLTASGGGRAKSLDTVTVTSEAIQIRDLEMLPPLVATEVNLGWGYQSIGGAAIIGNWVVVPSNDLSPGMVAAFPLDNPDSPLKRTFPQGNVNAEDSLDVYIAQEIAGNDSALFISYPGSGKLGMIKHWKDNPTATVIDAGMDPYGLAWDDGILLAAGRNRLGNLVLAEFQPEVDSNRKEFPVSPPIMLDFIENLGLGPIMAFSKDYIFVTDGGGPTHPGNVVGISRTTHAVGPVSKLEAAMTGGIAVHYSRVYVASADPSLKTVAVFDQALKRVDTLHVGSTTHRIAFADSGLFAGYGFATTNGPEILILHQSSDLPVGRFTLSENVKTRRVAIWNSKDKVVISTLDRIFLVEKGGIK